MTIQTLRTILAMTFGLLLFTSGLVFFMVVVGGMAVLLSLAVSAVTLISLPVLWLTGKRRRAGQLLTRWGIYLAVYLTISTGIVLVRMGRERPHLVGEEVCADSGCFAVDKVDRAAAAPETSYTLYRHLPVTIRNSQSISPGRAWNSLCSMNGAASSCSATMPIRIHWMSRCPPARRCGNR